MGETRAAVRIFGSKGHIELEMLVDTGATFTKIPASIAEHLGLHVEETIHVKLSDGSRRSRKLTEAKMEFNGAKMTVPVVIGPDGEEPLLGYTALEILRYKVDPVTRKLEKTIPIEY